ncbi:hypothetical protein [Jeotgalibacillus proteolyticus]|uniref:hypothetical protein n=1 Tax=Jeotgalibacillus proteolyticus TaxID=2082395 RepID=UPI003CF37D37
MNYFSAETVILNNEPSNQLSFRYIGPVQLTDEFIQFAKENHLHIGYEKQPSLRSAVRKLIAKKESSSSYEVRLHDMEIKDQYRYPHVISVQQLMMEELIVSFATLNEAILLKELILKELEELGAAVDGGALGLSKTS